MVIVTVYWLTLVADLRPYQLSPAPPPPPPNLHFRQNTIQLLLLLLWTDI